MRNKRRSSKILTLREAGIPVGLVNKLQMKRTAVVYLRKGESLKYIKTLIYVLSIGVYPDIKSLYLDYPTFFTDIGLSENDVLVHGQWKTCCKRVYGNKDENCNFKSNTSTEFPDLLEGSRSENHLIPLTFTDTIKIEHFLSEMDKLDKTVSLVENFRKGEM